MPASGSVLACPKLAPFSLNMPKPHCCCYAAQQGSLKKTTSHNKNQNAASHLQDVSETHGGWVQIRHSQTFMVRALGCKLRSLCSLKITSVFLRKNFSSSGLSVECFLPSLPNPQKATSLLAHDLNKYLHPPKHYEGISFKEYLNPDQQRYPNNAGRDYLSFKLLMQYWAESSLLTLRDFYMHSHVIPIYLPTVSPCVFWELDLPSRRFSPKQLSLSRVLPKHKTRLKKNSSGSNRKTALWKWKKRK